MSFIFFGVCGLILYFCILYSIWVVCNSFMGVLSMMFLYEYCYSSGVLFFFIILFIGMGDLFVFLLNFENWVVSEGLVIINCFFILGVFFVIC